MRGTVFVCVLLAVLLGANAIRRSGDEDVATSSTDSYDDRANDYHTESTNNDDYSATQEQGKAQSESKDGEPENPMEKPGMATAFIPVIAIMFASKAIPALDTRGSSWPMLITVLMVPRALPVLQNTLGLEALPGMPGALLLGLVSVLQFAMVVNIAKSMGFLGDPGEASIGKPAGEVSSLKYLQGTPVDVEHTGSVKVIEFWATWCAPCKTAIPHLNKVWKDLSKEYGKGAIQLVGVTNEAKDDDEAKIKKFIEDMGDDMGYAVAIDKEGSTKSAYPATSIPHAFVVGKDGNVVWVGHPAKVEAAIRDALSGEIAEEASSEETKQPKTEDTKTSSKAGVTEID
jgi:thiol-disulfide isomerase/thioredoxin